MLANNRQYGLVLTSLNRNLSVRSCDGPIALQHQLLFNRAAWFLCCVCLLGYIEVRVAYTHQHIRAHLLLHNHCLGRNIAKELVVLRIVFVEGCVCCDTCLRIGNNMSRIILVQNLIWSLAACGSHLLLGRLNEYQILVCSVLRSNTVVDVSRGTATSTLLP